MAKNKEFKVPGGRQPFYNLFKVIMRLIFRRPKVINLAGDIEKTSIVVSNHSAKSGPPSLDLYFPVKCAKWGAHEMFEGYKSRVAYLRDILAIKKCGKKPGFMTSFKAYLMAIFNPGIYKGMWMMPTYPDMRLGKTIKNSIKVLEANKPVMVFPENSNNGYKEVLTEFFPGFVMLAQQYVKTTGKDIPIYPVYYSVKKHIMAIDKPLYVKQFIDQGLSREQIAEIYKDKVNDLYFKYVENEPIYKGK